MLDIQSNKNIIEELKLDVKTLKSRNKTSKKNIIKKIIILLKN